MAEVNKTVLVSDSASRMLERLVGPIFGYIANSLVDAFVKRARSCYG